MSAAYNTRITTKLNELATMLAKNHYPAESTAIRTIIGKILNWQEGEEWNPANALSLPDADHVLEEMINKFKLTLQDVEKREMAQKRPEVPGQTSPEMEAAVKQLEESISKIV